MTAAGPERANGKPSLAGASFERDADPGGWDRFLRGSPLGHFQQSAAWGEAKRLEGWSCARFSWRRGGELLGGGQVLSRRTKAGLVGYVSKGPVFLEESPGVWADAIERMQELAVELGFRALLVQPPDESAAPEDQFVNRGFQRERFLGVITATLLQDLGRPPAEVRAALPRDIRRWARQAVERGVRIREADASELGVFFRLMEQSCQRQETRPNPATEEHLRAIWAGLGADAGMRLTFAEHDDGLLAGLVCIRFGRRVTIWKKGWVSDDGRRRPNHALYVEAFEWAASQGAAFCDYASLDPSIARVLLSGTELTREQGAGRDAFNLSFGGRPVLLPAPLIWMPSRVLRVGYGLASRGSGVVASLRHRGRRQRSA